MLDVANKYQDEIQSLFMDTWYDKKFKYYQPGYSELYKTCETNWDNHSFVSKNNDGEILGLISYSINRIDDYVDNIDAVNFSDDKFTYGKDLMEVMKEIFEKFNFRKINFFVISGNPIEKSYDKMVEKYGGRVVGIFKSHHRLFDNRYHDSKMYEIFRDDYLNAKNKRS